MQIVRNPVRKWLDKYETIPGRKYDCKLKEIQLENGVPKKWTNWGRNEMCCSYDLR